jgi:H+/Cl- antiporter ClcA
MLLLGAFFGAIAALFGEIIQRIFYAHADTHLDPPAAAIVLGTILVVIFYLIEIFETSAWVPVPF